MRHILALLAVLSLCAGVALAQTTSTTQSQTQVQLSTLAPAGTCFICDCNTSDTACRLTCQNTYSDPVQRQQCEASCGSTLAVCLSNAQVQQRALDDQRAAALSTTSK